MDILILSRPFFLVLLSTGTAAIHASGDCLPRLRTHPVEFEVCETRLCVLFINARPLISVSKNMAASNNQTIFRCKEREKIFPDLRGIAFSILDKMKQMDDVLCVYAGNQCSFNGILDLASTPPSPTWKYRLGVGGMAIILPGRIRPALKPLIPIIEGSMGLAGPRYHARKRPNALKSMFSPFAVIAWIVCLCCAIILFTLWLWTVFRSTGSLHPSTLARVVIGEPKYATLTVPEYIAVERLEYLRGLQERIRLSNKLAMTTVRFSSKIFLAVSVILWEITIVYYLFENYGAPVTINLSDVSKEDLRNYTVVHGGATEHIFRRAGKCC